MGPKKGGTGHHGAAAAGGLDQMVSAAVEPDLKVGAANTRAQEITEPIDRIQARSSVCICQLLDTALSAASAGSAYTKILAGTRAVG